MMDLSVALIISEIGRSFDDMSSSFVFDEIYRLSSHGVVFHVVEPKFKKPFQLNNIKFYGLKRKYEHDILKFIFKNISLYPPAFLIRDPRIMFRENRYAFNVARIVRENNVNLIHAHFCYPEGFVGLQVKRNIKKPLIVTAHGRAIQIESSINYGLRLNSKIDLLVRRVIREADRLIVASTFNADLLRSLGAPDDKIRLIPFGVDLERFYPNLDSSLIKRKLNVDDDTYIVFCLKSGSKRYGVEYLIRAAPRVLRVHPKVIFIVGRKGPLHNYYISLCRELGVLKNFFFVGDIPYNLLPYYYASCNVFVNPSLIEGFGIVAIEAMASGRPVIATNVGGTTDIIIDGFNGFLVKPKSPDELAEKIIYLLDNPDVSRKIAANGRRTVEEKFSKEKQIKGVLNVYREFI